MPSGYLVDTSLLRVFTSVQRLDLLSRWQPLVITPNILSEHGQAPAHAVKHLADALADGQLSLEAPDVRPQAQGLAEENPHLSYVDAEGLLFALGRGYQVFVADGTYRTECSRRGISTAGVASVLHALRKTGVLSPADVTSLADAMEAQRYYRFGVEEREGLGL